MKGTQSFYRCEFDSQIENKKQGSIFSFKLSTKDNRMSKEWVINRSLKEFHELYISLARKFPDIPYSLPLIKILGGYNKQEKEFNTACIMDFIQRIIQRTDVMTCLEAAVFFDLPEVLREEIPESEELMNPTDQKMN